MWCKGRDICRALPAQKKGCQVWAEFCLSCVMAVPSYLGRGRAAGQCLKPLGAAGPSLSDLCPTCGAAFRKETPGVGEPALGIEKLLPVLIIFLVNSHLSRLTHVSFSSGFRSACGLVEISLCEVLLPPSNPTCVYYGFGRGRGSRLARRSLVRT